MPKKIEKIKITRKKDPGGGSPVIKSHNPSQEPTSEEPSQEPTSEEPTPEEPTPQEPTPEEPTPEEPTPEEPTPQEPTPEEPTPEEPEKKILSLLESKDEEYLVEFMYNFLLNIKERENEIEKGDPVLWALIMELKELIEL